MRRTLALALLSLLALTLLSHAVAERELLPEEDPADAADGPLSVDAPENDETTSDLEEEEPAEEATLDVSLDEVSEEARKRRQSARSAMSYLKRLANLRRARQARLLAAWRLKKQAHLNRLRKVAEAKDKAQNLKKVLAKRASRMKARRAAKKAGKKLPKRKRGTGLRKAFKKASSAMKKRVPSIRKAKKQLRANRKNRAVARRKIRKERSVLRGLARMKARAQKFAARLKGVAARMKKAKKKIPKRLSLALSKAKKSLANISARMKKVVKRLKANVGQLKKNSIVKAKQLKKRVRSLRKPATDMIRKIRSVARKIGSKVKAAVNRVRKQGKRKFQRMLGNLVRAARAAKKPSTKQFILKQLRRLAALGRLAFKKIGKVANQAGKKTKNAIRKTTKAAAAKRKAAARAAVAKAAAVTKGTDLKRRALMTSQQRKALAAEERKAAAKAAQDQKNAEKVHARGCAAATRVAGKGLAKAERLRAKELKLIAFVKGKLQELTSLKSNEEVQKALELLSITRAHQEIVGPNGVTFLLTKLEEKLRGVSKKQRVAFNNKRNSCNSRCTNAMKYHRDRLVKSQKNRANARKRLNAANEKLQLVKGKEDAAKALYVKARAAGLKLLGRNSREQALLKALLQRVDQLAGVSAASESAMSAVEIGDDSDIMSELQALAPGSDDMHTVMVAMTRNHPEVRAIKKLLSDLLEKLVKEQDETRGNLRRRFRQHRRAGTETRLMQLAQKSAQWALNRVRNATDRNQKRVEATVKSCSGIPDTVSV